MDIFGFHVLFALTRSLLRVQLCLLEQVLVRTTTQMMIRVNGKRVISEKRNGIPAGSLI